jgi:hypothetical protein
LEIVRWIQNQSWKPFGDNADMAMIEVVDFNELYNGGKRERKAKAVVVVQKLKQTSEASCSTKLLSYNRRNYRFNRILITIS